jgi:hypothetical protein
MHYKKVICVFFLTEWLVKIREHRSNYYHYVPYYVLDIKPLDLKRSSRTLKLSHTARLSSLRTTVREY